MGLLFNGYFRAVVCDLVPLSICVRGEPGDVFREPKDFFPPASLVTGYGGPFVHPVYYQVGITSNMDVFSPSSMHNCYA